MCIIAVKSPEAKLDSTAMATLKRCWDENPHGAGFMFTDGDEVEIHKGYMSWRAFRRAVVRQNLASRGTVVFHFRIATQGVIESETCHPFPVSTSNADLKARIVRTKSAIAHNGIITTMPKHKRHSDTQIFIRDTLAIADEQDVVPEMQDTGSKFVLLTAKVITLVGEFLEEDGWQYSNSSYMEWEAWADYEIANAKPMFKPYVKSQPKLGEEDKPKSTPWHEYTDAEWEEIMATDSEDNGTDYGSEPMACMDCPEDARELSMFCEDCAWARGLSHEDEVDLSYSALAPYSKNA